jgi:hypothetical protein
MRFVAGNKTPRDSGNQKFEKDGGAASGIRRDTDGVGLKQNAPCKKHQPKNSGLAESPKALT